MRTLSRIGKKESRNRFEGGTDLFPLLLVSAQVIPCHETASETPLLEPGVSIHNEAASDEMSSSFRDGPNPECREFMRGRQYSQDEGLASAGSSN